MDYSWSVLDSYFKSNNYFLTKHHIDSYNDFLTTKIMNTVKILNPIVMLKIQDNGNLVHEVNVNIGGINGTDIFINKPTLLDDSLTPRILYPNEARLKNLTYKSDIYANISIKYITREKDKADKIEEDYHKDIKIGSIPIMLHSKLCALNNQVPEILTEMGECPYDQGGYFLIDGKEKVIVAQERIATNRIFINKSKDPKYSYEGLIRCTSEENPLFPKTTRFYVLDDILDKKDKIRNSILIEIPNIEIKVPIFVLFRALGIESDKDILNHISSINDKDIVDFIRFSLIDSSYNNIFTQEDAFNYLVNFVEYKNVDKLRYTLLYDLFPNVGYSFKNKALFLGYILKKLVKVILGASRVSDRDSYIYKRVDISGFLVGNLFRDYYNQFRNAIRNKLDNEYLYGHWRQSKVIKNLVNKSNIYKIFRSDIIEDGLKKSLKGMWGRSMLEEQQDLDLIKQGIVQDLSRISYLGTISHMRRVSTPMDPTAKIVEPHRLHTTQWGIMCPSESPDGASIGLIKNMSILCNITFDFNKGNVLKCLYDYQKNVGDIVFMEDINLSIGEHLNSVKILVNSNWLAICNNPLIFTKYLKLLKRNGFLNTFTSISWNVLNNEINILTEAGRCCRPLYVVDNNSLLIEKWIPKINKSDFIWLDLIKGNPLEDKYINPFELYKTSDIDEIIVNLFKKQAPIEFIDVEEANCSLVAMKPVDLLNKLKHFSYCEIHPSTIFGVTTHCIPFSQHNQAPRNIFSGAQGKQAIGFYATNFNNRIDTMSFMLHYPQKCLVNTRYMEYMNMNKLPNGENLIVAMCTYTGYNQEDAIIMNRKSVERGMFNLTYFKNIVDTEDINKKDNERIIFINPLDLANNGKLSKIKYGNYTKLDDHGFPEINAYIKEDDAIIGKCKVTTKYVDAEGVNSIFGEKVKTEIYEDKSLVADKTVSGLIDKVYVYNDENNMKNCKIRMRKIRTPELGDKCCSKHAQKGVIGMLIPSEDMPFTANGIIPDIIINPHCIPSRMTIAHLLECLLGKFGALQGTTIDGTPFCDSDYSEIFDLLETKFHLNRHGNEIMYNGITGTMMQADIFIGPIFYERLKHMVGDKINYRASGGQISALTRQPNKGRSSGSALRLGEMESNVLAAHGISSFFKESFVERSDNYEFLLDKKTHFISNDYNSLDTIKIKAPFAMKQLLQEITALGIKPELFTEELSDEETYDDNEFVEASSEVVE